MLGSINPTRISEGVGDYPCFLTFITMILIDYKISNFPYTCTHSIRT